MLGNVSQFLTDNWLSDEIFINIVILSNPWENHVQYAFHALLFTVHYTFPENYLSDFSLFSRRFVLPENIFKR